MSGIPPTYKNGPPDDVPDFLAPEETFGTIGVISGERGTYGSFWNDLSQAHMAMLYKNQRNVRITEQGTDICGNCNNLCRRMVGDWLWIMGDDHSFAPDLLPRLLAHNVDVVVPHCLLRNPPWAPVVYERQDEDGYYATFADLPEDELVPIHAAGTAGMLIRRHVLEAIADPWFTPSPGSVGLNEDVHFCQKVRESGFEIYCDSGAMLGHISNYIVWPRYQDGGWHIRHEFDQRTHIPILRTPEKVPA